MQTFFYFDIRKIGCDKTHLKIGIFSVKCYDTDCQHSPCSRIVLTEVLDLFEVTL